MKTFVAIMWCVLEVMRGIAGFVITVAAFVGVVAGVAMGYFGTGSEQVQVPDVRGQTVAQAEQTLLGCGLDLSVASREYSEEVAQDHVIRTRPYEGKRVKRGRDVQCVVSLGTRNVGVPRLKGLRLSVAESRLRDAGLSVADVRREASDQPRDTVLRQEPAAGAKIGRNEGVVVVLSGGKKFGRLPAAGGGEWLYRRVRLSVPRGAPLQRVQVVLREPDGEEMTQYDRVHRPGDRVRVNVVARTGWRLTVLLVGKEIFTEKL